MNAPLASGPLANIEALIAQRRFPEADRACDAMLSSQPGHPGARYCRALLRMHASRPDEALALLDDVLREHPDYSAARYLAADADRLAGRFEPATRRYADALARDLGLGTAGNLAATIEALVDLVGRAPVERWNPRAPAMNALGFSLEKSGLDLRAEGLAARLAESPIAIADDDTFGPRLRAAFALLAVNQSSSAAWMSAVAQGVLVPWMQRALRAGRFDNALDLENLIYMTYVVTTESQEHFRASFALWQDDMREAGKRFAATLPAPPRPERKGLPRVAFFVHNVTMLAHTTALLEVLEGHAELPEPLMEPYLFFQQGDPTVIERFRKAGLRVEHLAGSVSGALAALRKRIAEEGIEVLAWISLAVAMPFAFAMRLAPRQIWWAMKYHALQFAEIDDYLTGGGEVGIHTIDGRPWRVGPVVAGKWFLPELAGEAQRVRGALGARGLIYGCFGRAEKLHSAPFLDAVVKILRAEPDAVFLWTGRAHHAGIQRHFEDAGVAARCRFIGWVNTKLYAQVIDVFLDSFPFPGGFTLYEAMAAGKPPVLFASAESEHGGINAIVGSPLAADPTSSDEARIAHAIFRPAGESSLYLRAANPGQYVEFALALARDPAYRERVGRAAREFIEKLMTDRRRAARIYVDHLVGREIGA